MRNALSIVGLLVLGACEVHVGSEPRRPAPPPPPAQPAPPAAAPPARPVPAPHPIGRLHGAPVSHGSGNAGSSSGGTAPPPPPSGLPADIPASMVVTGPSVFGGNQFDPTAWKGTLYEIPNGTVKLPAFASLTPKGYLFDSKLDVTTKQMSGGFPGIDPTRNENFAIRFEAPLVVDTEADYTFKVVSDDGSQVFIDDTLIVDNDGAHTTQDKSGPVHLVKGTHALRVDYFQVVGEVALRLLCGKGATATDPCPTHLP